MAAKKTQQEIKQRRATKKWLQEKGAIPPDKPRLNRKKFCADARAVLELNADKVFYRYLLWALNEMLNKHESYPSKSLSPEAVGAAKVIQLAARRQAFERRRNNEPYKLGELMDEIEDIYMA